MMACANHGGKRNEQQENAILSKVVITLLAETLHHSLHHTPWNTRFYARWKIDELIDDGIALEILSENYT